MAADLVEKYMKIELESERINTINEITKAILSKELNLFELVERLGPYLTNPDASERVKGTQLLALLLHRLLSFELLDKEVIILVEFFCDRLKDHFSVIPHVVSGLLALVHGFGNAVPSLISVGEHAHVCLQVSYHTIPAGLAIKIVQAVFKEIHVQSLLQADRHNIYTLFSVLLSKNMPELQKVGGDFVFGFIQAMDGEKDPRNLLLCFKVVQIVIKNFPITLFAEDLFEVTSCYFPIDFTPPPNDPNAITREQLVLALRNCLAATSIFAPFCLPLLIEKLASDVIYAKKDALLTLAACANVYDSRFIGEYVEALWNYIRKEIFTTNDHSVQLACLEAMKSVVRNISVAEEYNHSGVLVDVLTNIFNDCKNHLLKPDHKLMKTSASLLQTVAMASDLSCAKITEQVIPILLEQFELHKQINNQKSVLDALLGFLQVAKEFVNKDTAVMLKNYKEKLLGLFFSLLVNHSPLHRSSGVAGLVAMVSSALLVEKEVMAFLDHLVVLILEEKEKIVRHEAKLALAYLSSQFPTLVRSRVVVQLTDRLAKEDNSSSMEVTEDDENNVHESPHITHEFLVTTLATLCTSHENVEHIVRCLVENLTTMCGSNSTSNERNVGCVVDCLQNIFEGCLRTSLKILSYYEDIIFLRVLSLAIANALYEQDSCFTSEILEKFSKLLRSISSNISESSSELIISNVNEIFIDGKLDRANLRDDMKKQDFNVLQPSSPWRQTQLVMFLTSTLCNISKSVVIPRSQELCSRLLTLSIDCCHKRTNIEASKCLAGLINRIQDDEKVEGEVRKCVQKLDPLLEKGRKEDEQWRATIVLIWIARALLIRSHSLGTQLLEKLLGLFCDPVIGQCAADGFYIIMSTSDDVMANSSCANIKLMYKQRIFIQVSPMLTKLFHSSTKETKHLYLCALSHILHWLPKQVLLSEIPTLLPLLVQSLPYEEANLQLSTLETFYSLTHDVPKIIAQYLTSIVPEYLHLAQNAQSLKIRCMSLKCLGVLTVLPHHEVHPYKKQVIKSLAKCLDDHKRLARKEAVQCRNEWFLLDIKAE